MELIDIKWAFASTVRRGKDFMERTGRTSLESKKDSPYGFDKRMVTCFNCREKRHFKRECTKPPQQGNQYPFNGNQVANNERVMVPANNANRALIIQADESCDWFVQLGNSGGGGTACYAEIVKNDSDGESSGNGDSSGYNSSLGEEGSSYGEDRSEDDAEVDDVIAETESTDSKEAALEQKIEDSTDDFSKHLSEVGSFTFHVACMARLDCQSS
ncbi:putative transcription factor interactor and regulator CCHC(Zn) family [Helianthus annuus]|nr:putative transcription factor interactor and regulator CCHC(Zn) family [Helianthus annuus]